ncbi:MAG: molecular chaperone HtpG [Victivallales bacterium]|nr:molecular chaperone HtpG [Victivallales bacterium]MCF7888981.1 molecular chaperone HtpG [Victivallales bacterium]
MSKEVRKFEAETQKVLDLVIHSLYTNKDIFLRELVANAADAIDKVRFEALKDTSLAEDWGIRIEVDDKAKTLKISDNGIGMTRDEVVENLGTIAQSGTKAFLQAIEEQKAAGKDIPELIGQFGVGFYSAFMVADEITVETKKAGYDGKGVRWISKGDGEYSLEDIDKEEHGSVITLKLQKEAEKYLQKWTIKEIIKKYSDFIEYPVRMKDTVKEPKEGSEGKDEKDIEYVDVEKDEVLNSQKAIWLRNPSEIKDEEYQQFFKHISHSPEDALKTIHFSAEGKTEFKALLYIPSKNPFNMFMPDTKKKNLHLYVRRIFITDECPNLVPEYLRFIDGVVDSSDLPLNVSRETLQDNPTIEKIQKNIVRKVIGELKKIKDKKPEKYEEFFKEFGRFIKEGVYADYSNKEKLQELLLFETMNQEPGKLISLKEYIDTMPSEQKDIYYIIGESRNVLENSPHLEIFRSKGFDVLFMTDPIDEFVASGMFEYEKKQLKAVGKGDIDLGEEKKDDKEKDEDLKKEYNTLLEVIQKKLDENVKEVRFSKRLTDSACCLVGEAYDQSPYMQRIMKSMNQEMPKTKRVLELNSEHPIVKSMKKLYEVDSENKKIGEFAELLYDQALLTEGSPIDNPLDFSKRVADLMVLGLDKEVKEKGSDK